MTFGKALRQISFFVQSQMDEKQSGIRFLIIAKWPIHCKTIDSKARNNLIIMLQRLARQSYRQSPSNQSEDLCHLIIMRSQADGTGLTISMTTERPHPVGRLWPRSLDVTQHQRPDRKTLLMGDQTRVFSPAGREKRSHCSQTPTVFTLKMICWVCF